MFIPFYLHFCPSFFLMPLFTFHQSPSFSPTPLLLSLSPSVSLHLHLIPYLHCSHGQLPLWYWYTEGAMPIRSTTSLSLSHPSLSLSLSSTIISSFYLYDFLCPFSPLSHSPFFLQCELPSSISLFIFFFSLSSLLNKPTTFFKLEDNVNDDVKNVI